MPERIKLTGAHIDEIAQMLRLGLALTLLGAGWAAIGMAKAGGVTPETLWDTFAIPATIADPLNILLFDWLAGVATPEGVLAFAGSFAVVGALAVLAGLVTRPLAAIFAFVYFVPWLAGLIDNVPWVWHGWDFSYFETSVVALYQPGIALLFLVLVNLGSGSHSLDHRFHLGWAVPRGASWDTVAVQVRFALSFMLLGAAIAAAAYNQALSPAPWYALLFTGALVFLGMIPRASGIAALALLLWGVGVKLQGIKTFGGLAEALSPDAAFLAAAAIFTLAGAGEKWKPRIKLTETRWGKVE